MIQEFNKAGSEQFRIWGVASTSLVIWLVWTSAQSRPRTKSLLVSLFVSPHLHDIINKGNVFLFYLYTHINGEIYN